MNLRPLGLLTISALAMSLFVSPGPVAAEPGPLGAERQQQGPLIIEGVPAIPQALSEKMNRFLSIRTASLADWDPQSSGIFILTRFGETAQVHHVASPLAYRQQMTFFADRVDELAVDPQAANNDMILIKDVGGNENFQLYYYNLQDGTNSLISNGKSRYGTVVWRPDGKQIAYQSTQRNGADWDIWIGDPRHPETAKMVFSPGGHWSVLDWSKDNRQLLLYNYKSITDSKLVLFDIASGKSKRLGCPAQSQETFAIGEGRFSNDGKRVFFTSDRNSEFLRLCTQDLSTGKVSFMAPEINWDVEALQVSPDGLSLAFMANEDAISRLYMMDLTKGSCTYRLQEGLPLGSAGTFKFSPDSQRLAVTMAAADSPTDVYMVEVKSGAVQRWTHSEAGGLNAANFVKPQLIHYPTFDKVAGKQRLIPAFCFMPKAASEKVPVLIYIHGGPESQYTPYFSSFIQFLACEMGIAVIAPNVRGSHGYGKTYVKMDNAYLREDSVKDIGSLIDWIATQPQFKADKVAVMGGSYGGYMTLASMTHFNDKLACGVDNVGISNFVTFLQNTNDNRRDLRRVEYGDERDPKMYAFMQRIAPSNNAHKITKPMLIAQGKNDPRVPVTEAEQMVSKIRQAGGDVWYICAEDEGHGFAKKTNRDFYNLAVVLFLQKHLCDK